MTKLKITQRRSSNGANAQQRETLRTLGLRRIGQHVERADDPRCAAWSTQSATWWTVDEAGK